MGLRRRSKPFADILTLGNYYSLRREHEKAIIYFRRALKLDRSYLSAWTLMGHEYVEIKNTNAAIASYRRAVGTYGSTSLECLPSSLTHKEG